MHLVACADSAVLVTGIDAPIARGAAAALRRDAAPWLVDAVPGLESLLVEVVPGAVGELALRRAVVTALRAHVDAPGRRRVTLDVRLGGLDGPDLEAVASAVGRGPEEVMAALTTVTFEVVLVGHLPGLPYLTGLPGWLAPGRRPDPRPSVPAGSVGVAGGMACIYPVRAPGGWQIVGRTDATLFDPRRRRPVLVQAGDRLRFRPR